MSFGGVAWYISDNLQAEKITAVSRKIGSFAGRNETERNEWKGACRERPESGAGRQHPDDRFLA